MNKFILKRIGYLLIGVFTCGVGVYNAFINPNPMMYGRIPIEPWTEIPMILIGLVFVYIALFKVTVKKDSYFICPTCQQACAAKDGADNCPQCSVPLEPLEGFYKRHPELKDKKEQPDC